MEDRLRTRGLLIKDGCLMCSEENETLNHILFLCPLARQVWALTLMQSSDIGFIDSMFTNMNHVMSNCQNMNLSCILRSISPWIIWTLWKNRNKTLFEGAGSVSHYIVEKAYEECNLWIKAQDLDCNRKYNRDTRWIPPLGNELKCNIGVAWSKKKQLAGSSWVVRDSMGKVIFHSRRSYSQVHSLFDAKIKSWEWALESMGQLHIDRVIFGASSHDIIKALNKPEDWPALRGHLDALLAYTKDKTFWFMALESRECNRGQLK